MTRERKQGLGRECYCVAEESVWEIFDPLFSVERYFGAKNAGSGLTSCLS